MYQYKRGYRCVFFVVVTICLSSCMFIGLPIAYPEVEERTIYENVKGYKTVDIFNCVIEAIPILYPTQDKEGLKLIDQFITNQNKVVVYDIDQGVLEIGEELDDAARIDIGIAKRSKDELRSQYFSITKLSVLKQFDKFVVTKNYSISTMNDYFVGLDGRIRHEEFNDQIDRCFK